ncbi:unnamed protein product, partial [marine sediment metagenome]
MTEETMSENNKKKGYFLKLVHNLIKEEDDSEAIYYIVSTEEMKQKALDIIYDIGYNDSEYKITEYQRVIEKRQIHEWLVGEVGLSGIRLEKLPTEYVRKMKINRIIENMNLELESIKEL